MGVLFNDYCYADDTELVNAFKAKPFLVPLPSLGSTDALLYAIAPIDQGTTTNNTIRVRWTLESTTGGGASNYSADYGFPACTEVGPVGHSWIDMWNPTLVGNFVVELLPMFFIAFIFAVIRKGQKL